MAQRNLKKSCLDKFRLKVPAQLMQLSQESMYLAFLVELGVVISTQVSENNAVAEYVVDSYEHGMCYSYNSPFLAAPDAESLILGIEVGCFDLDGCMRTLNQRGLEHLVPLGCPAGKTLSGTFIVAGRNTCP